MSARFAQIPQADSAGFDSAARSHKTDVAAPQRRVFRAGEDVGTGSGELVQVGCDLSESGRGKAA